MRDYKFRQSDLALRPRRRRRGRGLLVILVFMMLGGAGYGVWWWFQQQQGASEQPQPVHLDSNVIPLTLPPLPASSPTDTLEHGERSTAR